MIKLNFPFPPAILFPNKKAGWQANMVATKQARDEACLFGLLQSGGKDPPLTQVIISITWYPPDNRTRDFDSMLRAAKPIIDGGLVDAGFLADDSPKVIRRILLRVEDMDRDNPRTEIEIHSLEELQEKIEV